MLAIVLALSASALFGTADFFGGLATRRWPVAAVTLISQFGGLVALLIAAAVTGFDLHGRPLWLGAIAGVGVAGGLASFYKALALGKMSIVSPIAACSAVLPVAISLGTGERPSALTLAGVGVAGGGALLASVEEHRSEGDSRRAVILALCAALGFGIFLYFLGKAGAAGGTIDALLGARLGAVGALAVGALAFRASVRAPRAAIPAIVVIGLLDTGANALYAVASDHGLLSVVSVLGSLYPVVTVLLAYILLHERLTWTQRAGVATALAGVALVSAG